MNRLKFKSRIPYGGSYSLNFPEKGMVGKGNNFDSLIRSLSEWRRANSVPIGLGFEDEVEQELCLLYPNECSPEGKRIRKRQWGMMDIVRGTIAFIAQKLSGESLVDQAEASRRSELCSRCPAAVEFRKPCTGLCSQLVELMSSTKHKHTPTDSDTRACSICRCWTKVAVWFPLSTQCVAVDAEMKQAFSDLQQTYPCWKKCE